MPENDAQLIHRILSGDDAAFNTLVQRHQKGVHALAWRKIGDFHYAEEITQDTFLRAYKKLSTLKNPNQFAGWLHVIANRLCLNWIQRHKPAMQSLENTPAEEIEESSYIHHTVEQRETEDTEHRHEIAKKLLSKLPESERTVMTLHYLGEMTAKEISKFLGVSVNTITNRLWRARKRLREDEELWVREAFHGVQLPTHLTENIMRQVADMKPTSPPVPKPLLPWSAFGTATLLVALLLGIAGQSFVRYQQPYSFDAAAEPTVQIVDASIVLDTDSKPDVRNQFGRTTSADKNIGAALQAAETPLTTDAHGNAFMFSTAQWTRKADMPTARNLFETCVVNGKVFAIGGELETFGDIVIATVEMYDPKTDTWERKADMPTARAGLTAAVVDGKIYAIGGAKRHKFRIGYGWGYKAKGLRVVEMYDPATDTWTRKADMPVLREGSPCVLDGKIYIIGGSADNRKQWRLDIVDVYDPATDTWTKAKSMNHARANAAIGIVDGKIYAIGGTGWPQIPNHPGPFLASVEVFDPKKNRWTVVTDMPTPKAGHTASVINGKIYLVGGGFRGDGLYKPLSTIQVYHPATDRWTQEPDMLIGRYGHEAEVIDGQIYIFGGKNYAAEGPLKNVQAYTPKAASQHTHSIANSTYATAW